LIPGLALMQPQPVREIGARMAQTMDVRRLLVRQRMTPGVFGLAVALAAAIGIGKLIAAQLYQASAFNPLLPVCALRGCADWWELKSELDRRQILDLVVAGGGELDALADRESMPEPAEKSIAPLVGFGRGAAFCQVPAAAGGAVIGAQA
jgi:hypothetical protein